jgi:ELWxxDGT repeat protein
VTVASNPAPAAQVIDLDPTGSGLPGELVKLGTTACFVATTAAEGTELWKSDGTAAGTSIAADLQVGVGSSAPSRLTVAGAKLFFVADDGVNGLSLFVLDASGPTRLAEVPAWTRLVAAGSQLFFVGTDATNGAELWKTDGTAEGTALVKNIAPDADDSDIDSLVVLGSNVFFTADDGTSGVELWISDGSESGTTLVSDLNPGGSSNPSSLTVVGSHVYFAADEGLHGVELWRADANGATLVADVIPGGGSSSPARLTSVGTRLFFEADDGVSGAELWVADTVAGGAQLVKNIHPASGASLSSLTAGNGVLFFAADDGSHGLELWKSDGTANGTVLVKDLNPGAGSGLEGGSAFTFLSPEGVLLFSATEGTAGFELWKSDGGAMGTGRVADIFGGTSSSAPTGWLRLGDTVLFSAEDAAGRELWSVPVAAVAAPTIQCGTDVTVEATGPTGAVATYTAAIATDGSGAPTITYSKDSGATFPLGETTVTATATNSASLTATCTLKVTVKDTTPPTISCLATAPVEANTTDGAKLNTLPPMPSSDTVSATTVTYVPAPGSHFDIGTTFVTATATDASGNKASCIFSIIVEDTKPPTLTCPGSQTIEANNPAGAVAPPLTPATARDTASTFEIIYSPDLNSTFPLDQTTKVTVNAVDSFDNLSTCSFNVTVQDKTPPVLTCSSDITVEATASTGATVNYPDAVATDAVTTSPTITYSTASGTVFAIATKTITVKTQDAAGNKAPDCTFKITVQDKTPPVITCPSNITAEVNSIKGAKVDYSPAIATDAASTPTVTYSQATGSSFPVGRSTVTATAKDGVGNTSQCTFEINVTDNTPPVIACPADVRAQATSSTVSYLRLPSAQASDLGSVPTVTYTPSLSSPFPMGTTAVTATAVDGQGNSASCTFNVIVADTQPPSLTCPAEVVAEAVGANGATVLYPAVNATDSVSTVSLRYSVASGTEFPVGVTNVTVTAEDLSGNELGCTFPVKVKDTIPPTISCPGDTAVEATSPEGATVTYGTATASDIVSTPTVTYSHPTGMSFPLGQTTVSATATDAAGNASTCTFNVNVKDTVAPTITCPADVTAEATSAAGAFVKYPKPTVTDAVTVVPFVEADRSAGARFPLGTTPVTLSAADSTGNHASCTFNVTVRDTQGPVLTCPSNITVDAGSSRGAAVTFGLPTPVDAVSASASVTSDHESGAIFPVGQTTVKLSSADDAGNQGTCEFAITVNAPAEKSGCSSVAPTGWALLLALAAGWRMRRRQA